MFNILNNWKLQQQEEHNIHKFNILYYKSWVVLKGWNAIDQYEAEQYFEMVSCLKYMNQ